MSCLIGSYAAMNQPEVFNQDRMNRCIAIHQVIMDHWKKADSFEITIRATDSVHGITFSEFRTRYFAVGAPGNTKEIPFNDMLVVLSYTSKFIQATKQIDKNAKSGSIQIELSTDFSDDEAVEILSQLEIETPFDTGKKLRFQKSVQPPAE
jgi:hypothetical protein